MKHELKTKAEYFRSIWAGSKTFEIRNNDRDFHVDDEIVLEEIMKDTEDIRTGREVEGWITYLMTSTKKKDMWYLASKSPIEGNERFAGSVTRNGCRHTSVGSNNRPPRFNFGVCGVESAIFKADASIKRGDAATFRGYAGSTPARHRTILGQ